MKSSNGAGFIGKTGAAASDHYGLENRAESPRFDT